MPDRFQAAAPEHRACWIDSCVSTALTPRPRPCPQSKSGEYKRKTECKDGGAAAQNGEWKREFRDGPCKVKQEAKHDGYKEEVECKGRK